MTAVTSSETPAASSAKRPASRRARLIAGLLIGLLGLVAASTLSVVFGSRAVSMDEILSGLFSSGPSSFGAVAVAARVPRTVLAILVGGSLGLAGAVMQGATRNPLADPGILGINLGSALAVVVGISLFQVGTASQYIWFALAGAAIASGLVYAIASRGREGATPLKLALAGAATSAALSSLVSAVLLTRTDVFNVYRFWQVGGVGGADFAQIAEIAPFLIAGLLLALLSSRGLDILALGDDLARGLGARVGRSRALAALSAVLLAGAATAIAGPIGFVGLVVPHAVRFFTGPHHRWLLPYSVLFGAILLVVADVVGRVIAPPADIPVGIMTAIIGAPFFIALIRRAKVREL